MGAADKAPRQQEQSFSGAEGLILGIDPGLSRCGWALLRGDQLIEGCGHWITDADATPEERIDDLGERLCLVLAGHNPELVAVESFVFQGGPVSWSGLRTLSVIEHLRTLCKFHGKPFVTVTPAAPKKRLGIKGKPTHAQVAAGFVGVPRFTSAHARDAVLVAWAGWLKGVTT